MKQIDIDRSELKRLVESYGKEDVTKFVNHINEDATTDSLFPSSLGLVPSEKIEKVFYVVDKYGNTEVTKDEIEFNSWLKRGKFKSIEITGGYGPSSEGRTVWKKIAAAKIKTITKSVEVEDVDVI